MKEKLISINNSSESFEKSMGIMYNNINENSSFYDQYDVLVFYGDNLPKTNKELCITGTIGFYDKYMRDFNFGITFIIDDLWNNRVALLNDLVNRNIISIRNANKLESNYDMFVKVISMLPVTYVYPSFYEELLEKISTIIPNVTFKHLDLFSSYEQLLDEVQENQSQYKIYGLQLNGEISTFDFVLPMNDFYERSKIHLIRSISKSIVLSGNTAVLLSQIKNNILSNDIVGYRNHKYNRYSRQVALDRILKSCSNTVIEPKNNLYNRYFDRYKEIINNEEKANLVAIEAYHDFIQDNAKTLKI